MATKFDIRLLLAAALALALVGCATTPQTEDVAQATPAPPAAPEPPPEPVEYPVAPFEGDSLYELMLAEVAGFRGSHEVALQHYTKVTRETRDPNVAARATSLALYLNRHALALEFVRIWLEGAPDDLEAHALAVELLVRANRLAEAVPHMERIRILGGMANFESLAHRAAGLDQRSLTALHAVIREMRARYPDDEQIGMAEALLLHRLGRVDEALALLDQLAVVATGPNPAMLKAAVLGQVGRVEEAVAILSEQAQRHPANRRLRLGYARLLFQSDRLQEAQVQYEAVREQSPNDGDVLFALALIALQLDDDAEARRHLERMVRWNQRVGQAHFYLGDIAERAGDAAGAIREYSQVLDGREYLPAQVRVAHLLNDGERLKEARIHLERIRLEHPQYRQQLVFEEARLLAARDMEEAVLAFLDQQVAVDPHNADLLYFRAMTAYDFDRIDILERDLRAIISRDPQNADALNSLGYTLTDKTDRHEEALQLIERALAIQPNDPAIIDSMGWVQFRLKNYDVALVHLRRALALLPDAEIAAHLGEVLWVVGERREANQIWREALEREPDSPILQEVIERLRGESS